MISMVELLRLRIISKYHMEASCRESYFQIISLPRFHYRDVQIFEFFE